MFLKPRYKRRILWCTISMVAVTFVALIVIPPMITLNKLKNKIEQTILSQTGIPAVINGNINFSMIGKTTIVAYNIGIPNGNIEKIKISVPITDIFNLENAKLNSDINIYNAILYIDKLNAEKINHKIKIHNSVIRFLDKDYHIIYGMFYKNKFNGIIRTQQHKYEIRFINDEFFITNKNLNLNIHGNITHTGGAIGKFSIKTNQLNQWFEFSEPQIYGYHDINMDFYWDGQYGFKFDNIITDNTTGNIELLPDGKRIINLKSKNLNFDFSFLLKPNNVFLNTKLNLDLYGNINFGPYIFQHLSIDATGMDNTFKINKIIADDTIITGGYLDKNGAHDIIVQTNDNNSKIKCTFSGTPENWACKNFSYGDIFGEIQFTKNNFLLNIQSKSNMPHDEHLIRKIAKLGKNGTIKFKFADMSGEYEIINDKITPHYKFIKNKTLQWLNLKLNYLPDFMKTEPGDFNWDTDGYITFIPYSNNWSAVIQDDYFYITGNDLKKLFSNIDLHFLKNSDYIISGFYNSRGDISELTIKTLNHTFIGSISDGKLTLKTKTLNTDLFLDESFFDNYEENQFLYNSPILSPFSINNPVYLYADNLIYKNNTYQNFIYSLKQNTQTFSVTDDIHGNMLATITKDKSNYDIFIQLNKFAITGTLLSYSIPLNIRNSILTAEINLKTNGYIAHDIMYNMNGYMDLSFDGGILQGIGIDDFYASAPNITTLNAEFALANALESGETKIKNMRIIGIYNNGDFQTTKNLSISMRHCDAVGKLSIINNEFTGEFNLILRGTSPTPAPISLKIFSNNKRSYSISEIMRNFDPTYMKTFITTHNKF